jgi:uncharacterized membrane protein
MSDPASSVPQYLTRLAEALDVLGPQETAEIVAEIEGHLSDAIAERNGRAEAVLADFGTPEALATRILEERGILAGSPSVAQAPKASRLLAVLLDIAVWLLGVYALVLPLSLLAALASFGSLPHGVTMALLATALLAVLGWSAWWWAKMRGRAGHSTVGMRLVGLRRVRIGESVLTVRLAEIPGAYPPGRLLPALMVGFAILVVAPALSSGYTGYQAEQRHRQLRAVSEASSAASIVGALYREVENGASLDDATGNCAPSARSGVSELIKRRAQGRLGGYEISRLELVEYNPDSRWFPPKAGEVVSELVVRAHVWEYPKGSDDPQAYTVQVRERMVSEGESNGGSSASGSALIESIARNDNP